MIEWFRKFRDKHNNIQDRLFVYVVFSCLSIMAVMMVFELVSDVTAQEKIVSSFAFIFFALAAIIFIRLDKLKLGANVVLFLVVFGVLPLNFFTSGGVYGGAPIWFLFCAVCVCMIISDRLKVYYFVALAVVMFACYFISYTRPELVSVRPRDTVFIDSFITLFLITVIVIAMIAYEIDLYVAEERNTKQQQKEIEELNSAQNRFFSSMSHEIRTPINTIIGLNEMILREDISEEVAEDAANIRSASEMLLHLINDILDMSKIESGQMEITPVEYDIGNMLSEIVGMMWIRAKEKALELNVNVAPDIPAKLYGDEVRIKQILVNILNNAIKYTHEGSVTLSVQCERGADRDIKMIFSVSDTGIGIRKENIPYLFNAFRRVDESTNRYIEGTGLGLSIVKQFVDLMDGKITVNSVYTKGSTFIVELPQQITGNAASGTVSINAHHIKREKYRSSFEAPSARVLVVDDNILNLMVTSKLLRDTRVRVDTAESGMQALEKTLQTRYNVIFMDHMMPEMSGIECLHKIKEQTGGLCRNAKIVALTANAGSENAAMYSKEGFDGYLLKPVKGAALENELLRLLPGELITYMQNDNRIIEESMSWIKEEHKKRPVVITTESVADLPQELIEKHHITVFPHLVETENGVFRDNTEVDADGLLSYMADFTKKVHTIVPGVQETENFFANQLKYANNVIHISISSKLTQSAYHVAMKASSAFDNVRVIDSQHLSSGQGLLALAACRMAENGDAPDEIVRKTEAIRENISTSFIVDNMDHLAKEKQVSEKIAQIAKSFMIRPVLKLKKGKMTVGRMCFGSRETAWRKYIAYALANPSGIDKTILFVTYVGISGSDLELIKAEIDSRCSFEKIVFQKASPAIAVNCGPGTFGLLYMRDR